MYDRKSVARIIVNTDTLIVFKTLIYVIVPMNEQGKTVSVFIWKEKYTFIII